MRDLTESECLDLIGRHRYGRLGVRDADGVVIVPLSYALEGDTLVAHAGPGHKVHLMRLWPHVALEVDEIRDSAHWRSVLVKGRFTELLDEEQRTAARLALLRAFEGSVSSVTAGHGHNVSLADAIMFRIKIESISGRAESL